MDLLVFLLVIGCVFLLSAIVAIFVVKPPPKAEHTEDVSPPTRIRTTSQSEPPVNQDALQYLRGTEFRNIHEGGAEQYDRQA